MSLRALLMAVTAACACFGAAQAAPVLPRYDHVIVIVEENKDFERIHDPAVAPNISALAKAYGEAMWFWGEVHPSEANYIALLGGDTFGIHDDDAYYCYPGLVDPLCGASKTAGYVDHTIHAPHLGDQLQAKGLTWKGYYEDLPSPGSMIANYSDPQHNEGAPGTSLYATKHSGFINFASTQADPLRAEHIVGFDRLDADLAANTLPNFALVVPNQCNEMHGLHVSWVGRDCDGTDEGALIRRGDAMVGAIVARVMATPAWKSDGNFAIVITFDEGSGGSRGGCCGVTPNAPSNYGGGRIPTIVITNHGPRGVQDATPYNHYSLLRTLEQVFGIDTYLGHAAETSNGVTPMTGLFGVER